jgi:YgiT-type zinc finger domain-containing protein
MAFDFGRCPCGGGRYSLKRVTVRMSIEGRHIELLNVPQGACLACGSRVYKTDTLRRIESLMRAERRDAVLLGRR